MKKLLLIVLVITGFDAHTQAHVGVMGGLNLENNYSQFGVGLNYILKPNISVGAMAVITPFEGEDDYMIMYNVKYKLGKFYLVGGLMTGDMEMSDMNMMGMGMNSMTKKTMRMDAEPYCGIEYKPFKNKMLKIYYNHSDMMKSIGVMSPVFNLGKKMHMNH